MKKPQGSLISYFSRLAREKGCINLAQGKPGFAPPAGLVDMLLKASQENALHQYAPGNGNVHLLEYLCAETRLLRPTTLDNLLVVQGATEGLFLTFFYLTRLLSKPFSALSFDPVYEVYPKLAEYLDIPFIYFDFNDDGEIDFDQLAETCHEREVKIIFLASPGNPWGKVWQKQELERLIDLSNHLHIHLIFDGVYKDIYFHQPPYHPLALDSGHLFYVGSFSKMLSITGWRVGYVIAPEQHMKKMRAIHDYIGLCAPSLEQQAVADYLVSQDKGRDYTKTIRSLCKTNCDFTTRELEKVGFHIPDIAGGYFIWAQIPQVFPDGFTLARDLLHQAGVGVVPGENFSPSKVNFIRLNFATDLALLNQAVRRMKKFFLDNKT